MTDCAQSPARRRFVRTLGGGIIFAAVPLSGCSSFSSNIPDSAISAWSPEKTVDSNTDPRIRALSWAILAPNPHNRQPWLMELQGDNDIVIRIDNDRLLKQTDPHSRQVLIGTGAMLGLLDIAASQLGFTTETVWFEHGEFDPFTLSSKPVARVRLIKSKSMIVNGLFTYIKKRRTVRSAYDVNVMPPKSLKAALVDTRKKALTSQLISKVTEVEQFNQITRIAREAWKIELTTPRTYMENAKLLRIGSKEIEKYKDGISITSPLVVAMERLGFFDRTKVLAPDSHIIETQLEEFDQTLYATPAYYLLTSSDNTRMTQINAGKAYVEAHLNATKHGFVMHPLSQALQEFPEMSELYSEVKATLLPKPSNDNATVQMMCRIGKLPCNEQLPKPSPRRGLPAHLNV